MDACFLNIKTAAKVAGVSPLQMRYMVEAYSLGAVKQNKYRKEYWVLKSKLMEFLGLSDDDLNARLKEVTSE